MSATADAATETRGAAHIVALIRRRLSNEPARTREFTRAMDAFRGDEVDARNAAARLERLFPDDVQIARLLRALFRPDRAEGDAITQLHRRFAAAAAPAVRNQFPVERPIIAAADERSSLYPVFFAAHDAPTNALAAADSRVSEIAPPQFNVAAAAAAARSAKKMSPSLDHIEQSARTTRATLVAAYRHKADALVLENAMELETQLDVQRRHWSDVRRAYSARARAPARAPARAAPSASSSSSSSALAAAPRIRELVLMYRYIVCEYCSQLATRPLPCSL